jgi:dolichyl-phosphate-mannose--protein O-mannosyl transferase
MLEGSQIFFILAALNIFAFMVDKKLYDFKRYIYLGLLVGAATAVKVNGLILLLVYFFLFFYEKKEESFSYGMFLSKGLVSALSLFIVFALSYYIHFSLSNNMPTNKNYHMTKRYKEIVKSHEGSNPANFWFMLKENIEYTKSYSLHVPKFNPCKKGENGSFCLTWPFGNKSINYRWEKKNGEVRYLYLQGNPVIWFFGVLGFIFAFVLVVSRYIANAPIKNEKIFSFLSVFLFSYISYMIVMYNIPRVMYLYHYFVPLLFALILGVLSLYYIFEEEIKRYDKIVWTSLILLIAVIIYTYYFFSPLCYYKPLNTYEFIQRIWFDFWKLSPIR